MNCLLSFRNSAANKATEVVPSPTSASWDREISTKILAAGWTTSRSLRMVAPSFEIVVRPLFTIRISDPNGPRVAFKVSWIATHALIFEIIWPRPCEVSVPSFSTTMVGVDMNKKWRIKKYSNKYFASTVFLHQSRVDRLYTLYLPHTDATVVTAFHQIAVCVAAEGHYPRALGHVRVSLVNPVVQLHRLLARSTGNPFLVELQ
ncbi:hypothetical protein OGATHE_004366 [Ogataea polymorpha]|uniref:Uncharacterized protein n=1 Tax=Ogataea polymorpha TaxID=460523 RepID=A0A9P8NZY6_9ASCO|nr:hypothetical protein OGATHE_004366 [Ogataea polymorpha]